MEITKVEIQKNHDNRCNLYLDDEFYAGVSLELVVKYHLKTGVILEKQELDNLILEDEKGKALSKAVKYLGANLKTKKQLRDYLKKKEYNPQTIDFVISKMEEYDYLNDENFAKAYILTYSKKYGKLKLKSELKLKGVSDEIIDKYLDDFKSENIESVALKYLKNKERTFDTFQKLSRFLYSRGYEFDDINACINSLKGDK